MIKSGGQLSASDFNVELRRPWNQPISMADQQLRSLVGKMFDLNAVSFNEFFNKYLYPPAGTVLIAPFCSGYDLIKLIADGNGGQYVWTEEANAAQCGWKPPVQNNNPPRGTLLSNWCSGSTLMGELADGNGGSYTQAMEYNSPSCGGFFGETG